MMEGDLIMLHQNDSTPAEDQFPNPNELCVCYKQGSLMLHGNWNYVQLSFGESIHCQVEVVRIPNPFPTTESISLWNQSIY